MKRGWLRLSALVVATVLVTRLLSQCICDETPSSAAGVIPHRVLSGIPATSAGHMPAALRATNGLATASVSPTAEPRSAIDVTARQSYHSWADKVAHEKRRDMGNSGSPDQTDALAQIVHTRAPNAQTICELGVNMGHSLVTIMTAVHSPKHVVLFDTFAHDALQAAVAELPRRFPGTRFEFVPGHTHATVREFAKKAAAGGFPSRCDVVHIDAGHSKEDALPDIINSRPIASPGALVLLDDCGCSGAWWCEGVNAAVKQAVSDNVLIVISQGEYAWGSKGTCIAKYAQ